MKNLNICIDIDGTITDAYYWLDICNEYFNKNVTNAEVTEYSISNILNITEDEYIEFYENHKFKIHWEQKLRADVKSVIKKLNLLNNIYFVTARDKSLTMLTHLYLNTKDVPYNSLFVLGSHYKVDKAKDLNCNIFIEDSYDNAISLSEAGFNVLLIDTNYNRKPLNENITRVHDWIEIYEIINELSMQINCG